MGRRFADYPAFESFAVRELGSFWTGFLEWSGVLFEGSAEPACTSDVCERAAFFPGLKLSYVENLLRVDGALGPGRPALTAWSASGPVERVTRGELRERVLRTARGLEALGVTAGARVVGILANDVDAVVASLAATALGAVVSTSSPEMGAFSILARFGPLEPTVLMCPLRDSGLAHKLSEVVAGLPTLRRLIALDDGPVPEGVHIPVTRLRDLASGLPRAGFPRFDFNHPLFTLFSSGTTGKPKCIVHGAGGTLLEHLKEHRLHGDLRPDDTLFFQTSCSWMMWNWQLSALAVGAQIVLSSAPVQGPETLWNIAEAVGVTVLGTSPAYLQMCADAKLQPRRAKLRAVLSTGAVLFDAQFDWLIGALGALPVQSISGGTDILGCFVLGNPNLPVCRGESQCRSLGMDVRAAGARGHSEVGELVCLNPFPSRPLGFYGDDSHERFHDAYFSQLPGAWSHGDLVEFSAGGTARIHGRSDGVLNVRGVRIGPAELARILDTVGEVADVLPVEQRIDQEPFASRLVLLLRLQLGTSLEEGLRRRIRHELLTRGSTAHVPELIVAVSEFPFTHSGKRSDRAVREVLNGRVPENLEALRNPLSLDAILRAVERAAEDEIERRSAPAASADASLEVRLTAIWERVLDVPAVGLTDSFFDLGGTSLLALRMLADLRHDTGLEVPPSSLFDAPTVSGFAELLRRRAAAPLALIVSLRAGRGRPLFIVHGLAGDILELRALSFQLPGARPILGFRARGLDSREPPDVTVEEMASRYVAELRAHQSEGPYALAGYSFGGLVAFEMARKLRAAGQAVELLALIDTDLHSDCLSLPRRVAFRGLKHLHHVTRGLASTSPLVGLLGASLLDHVEQRLGATGREPTVQPWDTEQMTPAMVRLEALAWTAFRAYRPGTYAAPLLFLQAALRPPTFCDPVPLWSSATGGRVSVVTIPGDHFTVLREPFVGELARRLGAALPGSDDLG